MAQADGDVALGEKRAARWWVVWARSPWAPALVVFVALGVLLAIYFAQGGDIRDFMHIAPKFLARGGDISPYIRFDPTYHGYATDQGGYDGQFYYFIAVDPAHAAAYLDEPAYRFSRPLYPFLARALALGQPALIPWTLLLINWLAISAAVLALGDILRRRGFSPWLALLYAAFPGILSGLHADVTEPLAYGLVALALWLRERGVGRLWLWMGVIFALATLARETAAAFALALAVAAAIEAGLAARGQSKARLAVAVGWPALWLAAVMAPYLAWKAFILVWLGSNGVPSELTPSLLPYLGLAHLWPWPAVVWASALFVALPGALCMGLGLWGIWRRPASPEFWALVLHTFFFCLLLRSASWDLISSFRLSAGSMLALLWAAPLFARLARRVRLWMTGIFAIWVSLAPVVAMTFFSALARLLGAG